ncbi:uncharacterized protein [Clytia hemisphaerica]|uniref:Uncharacterized protein n=2 Tax=Clytia hemisphaerica TaxID=252671 RepID=A0A7M5UYI9_9CNID
MQNMQAGVYITCNEVPDYGNEQENVQLRLYICRTKKLKRTCLDAPRWSLLWLALFINQNIEHVEPEERFYERPKDVSANAKVTKNVPDHIVKQIQTGTLFNPQIPAVPAPKDGDNADPHGKRKMKRKLPSDDGQQPGPSTAKQALLIEPDKVEDNQVEAKIVIELQDDDDTDDEQSKAVPEIWEKRIRNAAAARCFPILSL